MSCPTKGHIIVQLVHIVYVIKLDAILSTKVTLDKNECWTGMTPQLLIRRNLQYITYVVFIYLLGLLFSNYISNTCTRLTEKLLHLVLWHSNCARYP